MIRGRLLRHNVLAHKRRVVLGVVQITVLTLRANTATQKQRRVVAIMGALRHLSRRLQYVRRLALRRRKESVVPKVGRDVAGHARVCK